MIPSIFAALGAPGADTAFFKRQAGAVIGVVGAVGAFGGFLLQVVFRQASLGVSALVAKAKTPSEKLAVAAAHSTWSTSALWVFVVSYVALGVLTWLVYVRPRPSRVGLLAGVRI